MSEPAPPTNVVWIPGPPCFDECCPIPYSHFHDATLTWEEPARPRKRLLFLRPKEESEKE